MVERLFLIHRSRNRRVDGIRDHGERLASELSRREIEVVPGPSFAGGCGEVRAWLAVWRRLRHAGPESAVFIQYNPFSFARWGVAPWLPAMLLALRLSSRRPRIAIMVHEPYVPMVSWRWAVMGLWQRLQLAALRCASDVVFATVDYWSERFHELRPRRPAYHLPVGSNLPDMRLARSRERERQGFEEGTLVVAVIARTHESWLRSYAVAALNEVTVAAGKRVVFLVLGAEAPEFEDLDPRIAVRRAGYLEVEELAEQLAAADLFLAPMQEGLTTKRTTVMAAFQHGLPVVATEGPTTDAVLRRARDAIELVPAGEPERFAAAAAELAGDDRARAELGAAARRLYEQHFDWSVVSERLLKAL